MRCISSVLPLPLFQKPEIDVLQAERVELIERIRKLPPYSHHRIDLECRLRLVTAKQISLLNEVSHG